MLKTPLIRFAPVGVTAAAFFGLAFLHAWIVAQAGSPQPQTAFDTAEAASNASSAKSSPDANSRKPWEQEEAARAFANPSTEVPIVNGEGLELTNHIDVLLTVEGLTFGAIDRTLRDWQGIAREKISSELAPLRAELPKTPEECSVYTEALSAKLSQFYQLDRLIERLRCELTRRAVWELQMRLRAALESNQPNFKDSMFARIRSPAVESRRELTTQLEAVVHRPGFTTNALDIFARYYQRNEESQGGPKRPK